MEENDELMKTYENKLSQTFRKAAEAGNLLRKADEEPSRDNKVFAEIQIAARPKAYRLLGEICDYSKNAIYFLKNDDQNTAEDNFSNMISSFKMMRELRESLGDNCELVEEQFNDSGQEVMETIVVFLIWPAMKGDFEAALSNLARMPIPGSADNEWNIQLTPQQWLAGLEDIPSELSKMTQDALADERGLELQNYEDIYTKVRLTAKIIYILLEKFESQNTQMLNCSHRRGQGFKEKLQRLKNFINERITFVLNDVRRQMILAQKINNLSQKMDGLADTITQLNNKLDAKKSV